MEIANGKPTFEKFVVSVDTKFVTDFTSLMEFGFSDLGHPVLN